MLAPSTHRRHYLLALAGQLPGEALQVRDADRLLTELHHCGWTDTEIAVHTHWTTYTVARKRSRLGLEPHTEKGVA